MPRTPINKRCDMTPVILRYGIIAGLIVSLPWLVYMLTLPADGHMTHSMLLGYTLMIVAFSMVFVGIKQYRDRSLGGAIRFGKALLLGLGISTVASLIYVLSWEICMAFSKYNFIAAYSKFILDDARSHGAGPPRWNRPRRRPPTSRACTATRSTAWPSRSSRS